MSILNVEHLSHGFGDRAIFEDVSFRLLKGEHIGLVGANGEGKSTFMNIITGRLMPDEGKIEWAKKVRVGYLDQHTALEKGMTIGSVLSSAFDFLYDMENEMNDIYARLGDVDEDEMNKLMEEAGTIQDMLTMHDFYMIDAKVEEVARALGLLDLGLDKDVTDLSGGQRTKVLMGKLLLEKPDILLLDEPTNYLDVEHIEWLKRYLNDYENAFILISHDIPFLNSVVNLIYHMDNKKLDRYVGDYDKFMEVYEMKKAQLEAAYNKQQQEIKELKDFVARNKARVATRNMAMSRQKKLDKMDVIELAAEKPKPEFNFKTARTPGRYIFQTDGLVIGYDDPSILLMEQIIELFIMILMGFIIVKAGIVKDEDSKVLSKIVLYLIIPCVIINAFQVDYTSKTVRGLLIAFAASVILQLVLLFIISAMGRLFHMNEVEVASVYYSNSGNLIVPIVTFILGQEWVLYGCAFMSVQLVFLWTHCKKIISRESSYDWRKIVLNINMISIVIGVVLFFTRIHLPQIINDTIGSVGSMIGPASMIVTGMLFAGMDLKKVFANRRVYFITFLRMLLVPLISLILIKISHMAYLSADAPKIMLIVFLAVITPSASTVTQMCQVYGNDSRYASAINVVTTLCAVVTMPVMVLLYEEFI